MVKKIKSIPKGAIKIHLYVLKNLLRPRGTMEKESLGLIIYERITATFESWSDPEYGDNPEPSLLIKQLKKNLMAEVDAAWERFINERQ